MVKIGDYIGKSINSSEQVLHEDFVERFSKATLSQENAVLSLASLAALGDFEGVLRALNLNSENVLHARESVTIFKRPPVEKPIMINTRIKDLYEQQAGEKPMGFVVVEVEGKDKSKKRLFTCERVYAVSGGFPRS
ncbi:MAG: MaoC family dehydratase N-terminal domain-containing protein [Deltaproteobacteria bacterium]|nr:MaoC family dehydratase N-terminal domain-containing protein [Deltaproteobacteria bacterium]